MIRKYAWQVSEEEYRDNNILSYSILAKYERGGFASIPTLFEHEKTNSLSLGSAFDIFFTERETFKDRVLHLDTNVDLSTKSAQIVLEIFNDFKNQYPLLETVLNNNAEYISDVYLKDFYPNVKKAETKIAKLYDEKSLGDLYVSLFNNKDRINERTILLNNNMYNTLSEMITCLRSNSTIANIAEGKNTDIIKRYFQLKFKTTINGRTYRCMFDEIVVNYEKKIIHPFDYKTTYDKAYNFPSNFLKWRYDIQDRLYIKILKEVLKDTEFKDYTIKDMTNIVVSTTDLNPETNPLLFHFPNCEESGNINISNKVLRDPLTIGEELYTILENGLQLPPNIKQFKSNNIKNILENEHY